MYTELTVQVGQKVFEFTSERDWINNASARFIQIPNNSAIGVDTEGRICTSGAEFMRAEREGTYPISVYLKKPVANKQQDKPTGDSDE